MTLSSPPPAWFRWVAYGLIGISVGWLTYTVDRTNISLVWLGYLFPFIPFLFLMRQGSRLPWKEMTVVAVLIRLSLILSSPNLSDDLYRFQWDGHLTNIGISPYEYTPDMLIGSHPDDPVLDELYPLLNSPEYYSIYPPGAQAMFMLAMKNPVHSVFWLRLFMWLLEVMTLVLLPAILLRTGKLPHLAGWYALNPLIIIELSGNIHLESGMIALAALSTWLLISKRLLPAALAMGLALSIKFTPLMIFPLLWRPLGTRRAWSYYLVSGAVLLLSFLPFTGTQESGNLVSSIGLYFHTFEFNGSWFYLYRLSEPYAYWLRDIFRIAFPLVTILLILRWSLKTDQRQLPGHMLLALSVYLFLSGNVHPWYMAPLLALTPFTSYRFPYIWAVLIPLTYVTYVTPAYLEDFRVVAIEYILVYAVLLADLRNLKRSG